MSTGTDVKLSKVGNIMLGVTSLETSLPFYRDVLGLPVQFAIEEFAFLDGGGVTIVLRGTPNLGEPGDVMRTEVVFAVEDIDAAYRSLQARGLRFRVEPRRVTGDRYAADFRDPDGHVLSIFGPRAVS
jgi:catechol 2,3-dioxygenase-like lactoylglutathione lyase family enzyme